MRVLKDHIVAGDTAHQLSVSVLDVPGSSVACHHYSITGYETTDNPARLDVPAEFGVEIIFQYGLPTPLDANGLTDQVLLAILIDRLRGGGDSPLALSHCEEAMRQLHRRTRERIARGVEGTHRA